MNPDDARKIQLLAKAGRICDDPKYPRITQTTIYTLAESKVHGSFPSKTSFHRSLKSPHDYYFKMPDTLFDAIRELFKAENISLYDEENDSDRDIADMYAALIGFANVSKPAEIEAKTKLVGHYKRYWYSTLQPNRIATGYLKISETLDGKLVTEEILPHCTDNESDKDSQFRKQHYTGFIIPKREHFLLITKGKDIDFPRVCILRPDYDDGEKLDLVGGVLGLHTTPVGRRICARKFYATRIDNSKVPRNIDSTRPVKSLGIGIHDKSMIPERIRQILSAVEENEVIFF